MAIRDQAEVSAIEHSSMTASSSSDRSFEPAIMEKLMSGIGRTTGAGPRTDRGPLDVQPQFFDTVRAGQKTTGGVGKSKTDVTPKDGKDGVFLLTGIAASIALSRYAKRAAKPPTGGDTRNTRGLSDMVTKYVAGIRA
jgi:hypothetical protein